MNYKTVSIKYTAILLGFLMASLVSCTPEPEPIRFGHDLCAYCKMMISDTRYGGELVTHKGKIYKYDSVECLAAWCVSGNTDSNQIHSLWVVEFDHPEALIDAGSAIYLQSKDLRSPMGLNVSAFSDRKTAEKVRQLYIGPLMDWNEVQTFVNDKWLKGKNDHQ